MEGQICNIKKIEGPNVAQKKNLQGPKSHVSNSNKTKSAIKPKNFYHNKKFANYEMA